MNTYIVTLKLVDDEPTLDDGTRRTLTQVKTIVRGAVNTAFITNGDNNYDGLHLNDITVAKEV